MTAVVGGKSKTYHVKRLSDGAVIMDALRWSDAVRKARRTRGTVIVDDNRNVVWAPRGR